MMGQYDDRLYEVGKGKPPKEHRWKTGQSGNPRGPKRKVDRSRATMAELLAEIINTEAEVLIGERRVKLTKKELILVGIVHDAANGPASQRIRAFRALCEYGAFDLLPRDKQLRSEPTKETIAAVVAQLAEEARRLGY